MPCQRCAGAALTKAGRVISYLKGHAPEKAFVGLFAAAGPLPFYARYGFAADPGLTGMFRVAPV